MGILRRHDVAWGGRAARTFTSASAQYLIGGGTLAALVGPPFTVAAWFRPDVGTASRALWSSAAAGASNNYFALAYDSVAGNVSAQSRNTAYYASNAGTVTEGTWNHAVAVFASSTSRTAYLNGAAGSASTNSSAPTGHTRLGVGVLANSGLSDKYDGAIANVAMWSAALSGDEIAALARGVHPTTIRGGRLFECWDLDRVGSLVGVVRGTVLSPVGGGALTAGPHIQGAPTPRRFFFGPEAGAGLSPAVLVSRAVTLGTGVR